MRTQQKFGVALVVLSTLGVGWQINVRSEGLQASPEQERIRHLSQLQFLAQQAISPQESEAKKAIAALREAGPDGMNALDRAYESTLRSAFSKPEAKKTANWQRVANAFEQVGKQRDNWASRLYWFTDLEKAKAEARKTNKPILSLRLLGNLDDELSCANSRFFRTALYPNTSINTELRSHYILHWESVRPVPKVTIDFGDGRKIETTITGNSIHYVLDEEGRVIDALPGLYGPRAFYSWIERAQNVARESAKLEGATREEYVRKFHQERLQQITREWQNDVGRLKLPNNVINLARQNTRPQVQVQQIVKQSPAQIFSNTNASNTNALPIAGQDEVLIAVTPTARNAAPSAATKVILERNTLERITVAVPRDRNALKTTTDDSLWGKIAGLHTLEARLDEPSLEVLRTKTSRAATVATSFQKSIAEDSVRNEYLRHTIIHEWLRDNPNFALAELNKKVYAEIFLTPDSDPWLGLLPIEAYTAIQNDGVVKSNG